MNGTVEIEKTGILKMLKSRRLGNKVSPTGNILINLLFIICSIICIAPIILITVISFTDEKELLVNGYSFFPEKY